MRQFTRTVFVLACLALFAGFAQSQTSQSSRDSHSAKPLAGVKTIQVDPTVVPSPDKVKDPNAATQVADNLKDSLKSAGIAVGDSPLHAHLVLNEFTGGSFAKRFTVGFGAGRSTVDAELVIQDASGNEIVSRNIKTHGDARFSGYEGNKTQERQAASNFEHELTHEIEKLK